MSFAQLEEAARQSVEQTEEDKKAGKGRRTGKVGPTGRDDEM